MYTDITTLEQAYARQKDRIDPTTMPDLSILPDRFKRGMMAILNLEVVIEAINNDDPDVSDFEPDFNDTDQEKWFNWYEGGDNSGAGFSFYDSYCDWSRSDASGGARLALRDRARAQHMKTHFEHLYREFYLILKPQS